LIIADSAFVPSSTRIRSIGVKWLPDGRLRIDYDSVALVHFQVTVLRGVRVVYAPR